MVECEINMVWKGIETTVVKAAKKTEGERKRMINCNQFDDDCRERQYER